MNATDQYLMSQVGPMLAPGEQVLFMSTMRRMPAFWKQALLGGLLTFLVTKTYLVVLTNQKMLLILSKQGMFGGVKQLNLGVEAWDVRTITNVQTGGFLANKSMTFFFANGPKQTLRITPQLKTVSGTKDFFQQVPGLLNSGQLGNQVIAPGQPPAAQLPPAQAPQPGYDPNQLQQGQPPAQPQQQQYGAPPQQQQPPTHQPYGAPPPQQEQYAPPPQQQQQYAPPPQPQQQYAPPQQQQHYAPPHQQPQQQQYAPPPQMQQGPFPPGTQVVVTAPDGSRHLASIVQEQQGHYLCAGPAGQGWVPAPFVARA